MIHAHLHRIDDIKMDGARCTLPQYVFGGPDCRRNLYCSTVAKKTCSACLLLGARSTPHLGFKYSHISVQHCEVCIMLNISENVLRWGPDTRMGLCSHIPAKKNSSQEIQTKYPVGSNPAYVHLESDVWVQRFYSTRDWIPMINVLFDWPFSIRPGHRRWLAADGMMECLPSCEWLRTWITYLKPARSPTVRHTDFKLFIIKSAFSSLSRAIYLVALLNCLMSVPSPSIIHRLSITTHHSFFITKHAALDAPCLCNSAFGVSVSSS